MTRDEAVLLRDVGAVLDGTPTDTVLAVLSQLMAATIAYGAEDIKEADAVAETLDARMKILVRQNWAQLRRMRFDTMVGGTA